MANTSADEVAELKQELAQFLLTEITSVQGAQTFRKEVGVEVAAVIDQVLNERLTPALQRIESQATEQANALTARVDAALRRFEQAAPVAGPSPEIEQKIAELTARLDEMRARLLRTEEQGRRAVAQPIAAPKLADERIAVTPKNTSLVPRWALWVIILLLAPTALAIGNIYVERMTATEPLTAIGTSPAFVPPAAGVSSSSTAPAPATSAGLRVPMPAPPPFGPTPHSPPSSPALTPTRTTRRRRSPHRRCPATASGPRHSRRVRDRGVAGSRRSAHGTWRRAARHITTLKSLWSAAVRPTAPDSLFGGRRRQS